MDLDREHLEVAQTAARMIVEDGLDYASARRKAMLQHGEGGRRLRDAPSNEAIEDEVRTHIAIFHADTQPAELRALREAALRWMLRLAEFRPHVGGAVWRGTATRQSVIRLDLYCDDIKATEIALLNRGIAYETVSEPLGRDEHALTLVLDERNAALDDWITIHLHILDHDDLRGALKPDGRGHTWRGDAAALQRLLEEDDRCLPSIDVAGRSARCSAPPRWEPAPGCAAAIPRCRPATRWRRRPPRPASRCRR